MGDVALTVDEVEVAIGAPKERHLLIALVLEANTTVSNDRLIDSLWPEDAPAKPLTSLRAYVSNLRRTLERAGADPGVLATETGGYSLRIDPESVDSHRFETLLDDARDPAASPSTRADTLDSALALVRGEPLGDMPYADFAQPEIRRLTELIVGAEELRAELAIERGEGASQLARIAALVEAHPLRERLRVAHMRALVAAGRHSEALRSYQDHRTTLIDEMGVEPGPSIRALEAEILALDSVEVAATGSVNSVDSEARPPEEPAQPEPAERRLVSVLSVDFAADPSETVDPEDLRARDQQKVGQRGMEIFARDEHGSDRYSVRVL